MEAYNEALLAEEREAKHAGCSVDDLRRRSVALLRATSSKDVEASPPSASPVPVQNPLHHVLIGAESAHSSPTQRRESVASAAEGAQTAAVERARKLNESVIQNTSAFVANQVRAGGFTARDLRAGGFRAAEVRSFGYSAAQCKAGGFSAGELRKCGVGASELKDGGFSVRRLRAAGFSAAEMRRARFTAAQMLKSGGYTPEQCQMGGYSAAELAAGGATVSDMRNLFSLPELREAGFDPEELHTAGFSLKVLKDAGYSWYDFSIYCSTSLAELRKLGYTDAVSVSRCFEEHGCNACLEAGYSISDLLAAGIELWQLERSDSDVTTAQLRADHGFDAAALREAGFAPAAFKGSGFSVEELSAAGFRMEECLAAGFSEREIEIALNPSSKGGLPKMTRARK
jgi:ribosomal protein L13E